MASNFRKILLSGVFLAVSSVYAAAEGDYDRFPIQQPTAAETTNRSRPAKALPRNPRCAAILASARMDSRVLTEPRLGGSLGLGLGSGGLGIVPALGFVFSPTNSALATAVENRASALCRAETQKDLISRWLARANAEARMGAEIARAASLDKAAADLTPIRDKFQAALSRSEITLTDFLDIDRALAEIKLASANSRIEAARHRATIVVAGKSRGTPSIGAYLSAARDGMAAENELRRAGAKNLTVTIGLGLSISGYYATGDSKNRDDENLSEAAAVKAALSQWSDIPTSVNLVRSQAARESAAMRMAIGELNSQRTEIVSLLEPLSTLDGVRAEAAKAAINARLAILDAERTRMSALSSGLARFSGLVGSEPRSKKRRHRGA